MGGRESETSRSPHDLCIPSRITEYDVEVLAYSAWVVVESVVAWLVYPETKGPSLQEIVEMIIAQLSYCRPTIFSQRHLTSSIQYLSQVNTGSLLSRRTVVRRGCE